MKKLLVLGLLLATFLAVIAQEDYYKILEIPKNADESQIKKAFKKLSLKYHPDRNRGNEEAAKQKFVKIAQAYETLSDPEKRKVYDQYGEEGVKRKEQGGQPGGGGGFHGNFDDMFSSFFGGGGFQFNFGGGGHHGFHQGRREEPPEDFWQQSDVITLSMSSLSTFYRRNEVWLILFYKANQAESKQYKDVWRETAEKLYGIIRVAAVNCMSEADEAICEEYAVYDVPKVLCFPANSRLEPFVYDGRIDYNSIAGFGVAQMESFVKLVNDQNYQDFANEDFDKTKVLLFTAKKVTPPLLKALSKDFKGRVVFGEVRQSNTNLIQKFQITNFPTLIVLSEPLNYLGVTYQGDFKKDQIAKFLREHSSAAPKKSNKYNPGILRELTPNILNSGPCSSSDTNLCLLAILDKHSNSKNDLIKDVLSDVVSSFADDPIQFFYISSGNIDYSNTFSDSQFPALYIIKGKRGRYVKFDGTFDKTGVKNFVESVISGTAQFAKMGSELSIGRKTIEDDL